MPSLLEATFTVSPAQFGTAESTVSAPGVTPTSRVLATLAPCADWDADELAGLSLHSTPIVDAIVFTISRNGPIGGDFAVHYLVTP